MLALKSFAKGYNGSEILLRIDNTTAVAYVNKMGGIQHPNLHKIAKEIWQWCEARNIWITASYIKSGDNVVADRESRIKNIDTEWELADHAFRQVVEKFGHPEIDLFATRNNTMRKILGLEKRPRGISNRYFYGGLTFTGLILGIPAIRPNIKSPQEGCGGPGHRHSYGPLLDQSTVVPIIHEFINRKTTDI